MPRPKSNPNPTPLSSGQAAYVLDQLIKERRVSQTDINRYVGNMGREISDLEARLQRLREAHGGSSASSSSSSASSSAPAKRGPGRPKGYSPKAAKGGKGAKAAKAAAPARPAAASQSAPAAGAKGGGKRSRKSPLTAEQLASRQLQGRYLALVRQFPEKKRAEYAKLAKEKGREAAIKEMQDARK
ncbi:MAG: hypothetical protein ACTHQM_21275 [Thermoanaerobaculia bacterium]